MGDDSEFKLDNDLCLRVYRTLMLFKKEELQKEVTAMLVTLKNKIVEYEIPVTGRLQRFIEGEDTNSPQPSF